MRLLDTYALNCGAKIAQPFLYEAYFPLPIEKYITFQAQSKFESKDYAYWQDVIDILFPVLAKQNINIIQLGAQNETGYQRVIDLKGKTSPHQLAYIMGRAMLHFGPDSLGIHLASSYNIPVVGLYSATMPEIAGPHFGDSTKQILFKAYERVRNKKPSFSNKEDPKSINTLKPEEIAASIFKLLNVDIKLPFETVFTGARYGNQVIREMIPDVDMALDGPNIPVELRYDMHSDENLLAFHLSYLTKAVIVTDKRVNINLLTQFKSHIPLVVYRMPEKDDPEFIKEIISLGIPALLVSNQGEEVIQKKKINYYEFGPINPLSKPDERLVEELRKDINKLFFRSNKLIASGGKIYATHASRLAQRPLNNMVEFQRVIDTEEFWNDMDFVRIVKELD